MLKKPYLILCALVFLFSAAFSYEFAALKRPADKEVARKKAEGYLRQYSGLYQCSWQDTFAAHQVVLVVTECPNKGFVELMSG